MRRLAVALASVALLAACGGSSPEEVVDEYLQAVLDGDGAKVCELLSDEAREAVEQEATAAESCEKAIEVMTKEVPAGFKQAVEEDDVKVTEDGDTAKAEIYDAAYVVELKKDGGDWVVTEGVTG